MEPPQSFENSVSSGSLSVDYKDQLFEYGTIAPPSGFQGNPTGTFRMLLFKVAMGRVFNYSQDSDNSHNDFLKFKIPNGFNSLELVTSTNLKRFNTLYRVSDPEQVLLYAAVEFEFTPLRVQVPDAVCDMCESAMAKWYCHSDRAHFCTDCDMKQHGSTRIFSRHIRVPSSKSPNQFGLCEHHPTEVVDMVCLKCSCLLCNNCILFGKHSKPSFFDHPLMSTLDTYELSLEKNSDSDEKLKSRRDEISDKIKNCHNSTSQIYANSKGVENKIDYCKKMLLQQLDEMKKKKMNYLNSIEREVKTQLNLIQWMQNFLHHIMLSLEPCKFIQFKAKYDLLVKKYFTKNLKNYLEFPVWMNKHLVLVGETKITSSPISKLSQMFSNDTSVKPEEKVESQAKFVPMSNQKLVDWTPLNMFDDLNETVGRVSWREFGGHSGEDHNSSSTAYSETSEYAPVIIEQSNSNELDVIYSATKLWQYLSDLKMGTSIQLLKLVEVHERSTLVKHVLSMANHFEQLEQLFTHLSNYEMDGLVNDFGYCVLLRSSGLLSDVLSFLFCSNFTTEDNLDFLKQMTVPVENYFNMYLKSVSNSAPKDATTQDSFDPILKEHVNNCMVEIVTKLVSLDIISFPTSYQYVLYALTDLFRKLKSQYRCYIVGDFLFTVLSNYLLRYPNYYSMGNLLNDSGAGNNVTNNPDDILNNSTNVTGENEKYNNLKSFTRELSFKFARAGIVVWELDSLTLNDSDELRQSQKVYDWAEKMLTKPRLKCSLLLRTPTLEELEESHKYVLSQASRFEKRLNSGQVDISYKYASELTSKYNFFHLFKMANQIPI
ncbi:RNA polymerases I and III subunit [Theileria orientalis]|uniref:RNA polymerases I and III subunit n=1 Tax=Theileria orientalis TaxID=68886 RepID=A0A976M6W3_THEOR|nr:RNA polymerases I and III subunit [Theileria orientalis]